MAKRKIVKEDAIELNGVAEEVLVEENVETEAEHIVEEPKIEEVTEVYEEAAVEIKEEPKTEVREEKKVENKNPKKSLMFGYIWNGQISD